MMERRTRLESLPAPPKGRQGWPWTVGSPAVTGENAGPWPRISIVTPTLNQGAYIEETIRSVLLQDYPDLQYVVIDGGSSDGTLAILERYAPWIDYRISEPDRGQSDAINKGLRQSDGAWFNWLNSDDYLMPGALASLAAAARATAKPIVSGVTLNIGNPDLQPRYAARAGEQWPGMLFNLGVNQPGSLLRAANVREFGGVRDDLALCMDLDLWIRLALAHGPNAVEQVPDVVATYRYHAASKTCSGSDVFAREEFELLTELATGLGGMPDEIPSELRGPPGKPPRTVAPARQMDKRAVERAYLDRLIVSDSLLYRAIFLAEGPAGHAPARFLGTLEALGPALRRLYPASRPGDTEASAIIHALQLLGRPERRMAWRALRLSPRPSTLMELFRVAYHGAGRKP
jgi:hypothetical protein